MITGARYSAWDSQRVCSRHVDMLVWLLENVMNQRRECQAILHMQFAYAVCIIGKLTTLTTNAGQHTERLT